MESMAQKISTGQDQEQSSCSCKTKSQCRSCYSNRHNKCSEDSLITQSHKVLKNILFSLVTYFICYGATNSNFLISACPSHRWLWVFTCLTGMKENSFFFLFSQLFIIPTNTNTHFTKLLTISMFEFNLMIIFKSMAIIILT